MYWPGSHRVGPPELEGAPRVTVTEFGPLLTGGLNVGWLVTTVTLEIVPGTLVPSGHTIVHSRPEMLSTAGPRSCSWVKSMRIVLDSMSMSNRQAGPAKPRTGPAQGRSVPGQATTTDVELPPWEM